MSTLNIAIDHQPTIFALLVKSPGPHPTLERSVNTPILSMNCMYDMYVSTLHSVARVVGVHVWHGGVSASSKTEFVHVGAAQHRVCAKIVNTPMLSTNTLPHMHGYAQCTWL